MKAVFRSRYGNPEVLSIETIPRPQPGKGELLIRVHATTVNRTDCGILRGSPWAIRLFTGLLRPSSPVPGTDFAGQVVETGPGVTAFRTGDRVWGLNDEGLASQAEFMVIRADRAVARIPDHFSCAEVVACAEGAHYALNFINKVKLAPGDRVLVNGATGAIGSAALQLLTHRGIRVTAVGDTPNLELLRELGAEKVYDYLQEDFRHDPDRYRCVFDAVGKSTFGQCRHLLQPGGIYLSSELGPKAENLYLPLVTRLRGGPKVIFPIPRDCRRSIRYLSRLIEEKAFRPVIDRRYRPEDIRQAYTYTLSGQKTGNVIVDFS